MPVVLLIAIFLFLPMADLAADILIHDANGYAGSERQFTWMTIHDGRVTAIGSGHAPKAEYSAVIDVHGRTVMPGLTDAHGHVLSLGRARSQVDLVASDSLPDALARVADQAPPGKGWILGRG